NHEIYFVFGFLCFHVPLSKSHPSFTIYNTYFHVYMTEVEGVRPMAQCPRKQIFGGGGCGSDGNKTCIKSFAKQGGDN
ncbi:hypothetical protein HID58_056911, partial [Brassica napus]